MLNNLKLIKKNKSNYTFKIENIELQNKEGYFKKKYIKNLNNVFLEDIIVNFDPVSFITDIKGKILLNNYTNSFYINGAIKKFREFNGGLTVNIDKFPIFTFLENNVLSENQYKINNISSVLFSGKLTAKIKDNLFEQIGIKLFSKSKYG